MFYVYGYIQTRWVMTDLLFNLNVQIQAWLGPLILSLFLRFLARKTACDLWDSHPKFSAFFFCLFIFLRIGYGIDHCGSGNRGQNLSPSFCNFDIYVYTYK